MGAEFLKVTETAGVQQKKPRQLKAEKFYLLHARVHVKPRGIELLNGDELFAGTAYRTLCPPGNLDRGFRQYPVRPHFRISKRLGRKLNDIEFDGDYWILSDRAKNVFAGINATDFAFLPVESTVDPDCEPVTIWLADIVSVLDAVDDTRSRVEVKTGDSGERVHHIHQLSRLIFNKTIVGSHHIFRLTTNFPTLVCDHMFKDAVKEAALTGLSFRDAASP